MVEVNDNDSTSTELFPSSSTVAESFDAPRLERLRLAQTAEAEEKFRRRSLRWRVLQNQHRFIQEQDSVASASAGASVASSTGTGMIGSMSIKEQRDQQRDRAYVKPQRPIVSATSPRNKMPRSSAAAAKAAAAVSTPVKKSRPSPPQEKEEKLQGEKFVLYYGGGNSSNGPKPKDLSPGKEKKNSTSLESLSFLARWCTAAPSTKTVPVVKPSAPPASTTSILPQPKKAVKAVGAPKALAPKNNATKIDNTKGITKAKAPILSRKTKQLLITPPSPGSVPPQVVMTATRGRKSGMSMNGMNILNNMLDDTEDTDDDQWSQSSESLTLFQLGHLMQDRSRGRLGTFHNTPKLRKNKNKTDCDSNNNKDMDADAAKSAQEAATPWIGCFRTMVVVGAVLSLTLLLAAGSLFWTLTSRYNDEYPVLTVTFAPLPLKPLVEHVQVLPHEAVLVALEPVPRDHRPAQDMIEHAVSKRIHGAGLPEESTNAPLSGEAGVSAILEEQGYTSPAREDRRVPSHGTSLPSPASEVQLRLLEVVKRMPTDETMLDETEGSTEETQMSQMHNADPADVPAVETHDSSTLLQNLDPPDLPVEEETHDSSTLLQNLDPVDVPAVETHDSSNLLQNLDPVDVPAVETHDSSNLLQNLDPPDQPVAVETDDSSTSHQNLDLSDENVLRTMVPHASFMPFQDDCIADEARFGPAFMDLNSMDEEKATFTASLPKCSVQDRWNETMLSTEASEEFVVWAQSGFWKRPFSSPRSSPPLQDAGRDFSADAKLMRFIAIMDPDNSIVDPSKSCRSWDSLVGLEPYSSKSSWVGTLKEIAGGDADDNFLHVPLLEVVRDFLMQKIR
jgi:hypothetical protein